MEEWWKHKILTGFVLCWFGGVVVVVAVVVVVVDFCLFICFLSQYVTLAVVELIHCVDQVSPELTEILLPRLPWCWY